MVVAAVGTDTSSDSAACLDSNRGIEAVAAAFYAVDRFLARIRNYCWRAD